MRSAGGTRGSSPAPRPRWEWGGPASRSLSRSSCIAGPTDAGRSGCSASRRASKGPVVYSWGPTGGCLGLHIAALGALFAATGHPIPVDALVLGYLIGYLANVLPVPGGFGVLEA